MEKVTLTKGQTVALDMARENLFASEVVATHARLLTDDNDSWSGRYEPLNRLKLDEVIRALYIGYEVEQTPEEKVFEYYKYKLSHSPTGRDTTQHVLDLLGIKIKGINS